MSNMIAGNNKMESVMPAVTLNPYAALLAEAQPGAISTWEEYETIGKRLSDLLRKGRNRTAAETRFMRLLGVLIQDYDQRHSTPPEESTPAERLEFLLEQSGKTRADLLPIFGQKSHVSEVLSGKRAISRAQAEKLGAMFSLKARHFF